MTIEKNKTNVNRITAELNKGNGAVFYEVTDPKAVDHSLPPGMPQTVERTKLLYMTFRAAFPDLKYTVEDVIAEGDKLVQRQTAHGTMTGALQGMPAAGKQATWTETHIVRFENDKIVERWANVDRAGMLQQLGLMTSPSQN